ncbi:MAG TPA: hypothetical protein VD903_10520 [Pseudonocardia sp.]|nr:hypothetical protein [Pseudonocardia sp.]
MQDSGLTTTPASARTDVRGPVAAATDRGARTAGLVLAAGAAAYATTFLVIGPTTDGIGGRVADLAGLVFQAGLFGLLAHLRRTRATGTSRTARRLVDVEFGLLGLASLWSLLHATVPAGVQDAVWLAVLDVCWPLSMLGMLVVGTTVAAAGRWRGILRAYPAVAASWVLFGVPSMALGGPVVGAWVGGVHMLLGYAVLGLLLALRPQGT